MKFTEADLKKETYFKVYEILEDKNGKQFISLQTREFGSVTDETPGPADWEEAERLVSWFKERGFNAKAYTVNEWTMVEAEELGFIKPTEPSNIGQIEEPEEEEEVDHDLPEPTTITVEELAKITGCSPKLIRQKLRKAGFKKKSGRWSWLETDPEVEEIINLLND